MRSSTPWRRRSTRFEPELLLVSAGFDAHVDDPLADMRVTDGRLPRAGAPARCFAPRVAAVLEGGYNLDDAAGARRSRARRLHA